MATYHVARGTDFKAVQETLDHAESLALPYSPTCPSKQVGF